MSGFFGILRSDGQEIPPILQERIAEAIRFRGPDGEATWTQPGVATCFSFFEIGPAKQTKQQPVILAGNWILGDVRIDARSDLVKEMGSYGAPVSNDSTSEELLLHAWQIWDGACLERVIGDFSFALWDDKNQSLFCARDFVGPRPFYYAFTDSVFCFSNTLEALQCVSGISTDLDEAFVGEFLLQGYCADLSRTIYSKIRRLPAGHLLKYKNQRLEIRRFHSLGIEEPFRYSRPEDYLEQYRQVLNDAVLDRLPQRPTALYLSGGLDSGAVCATAARIAEHRGHKDSLKAFTVGWNPIFEDPEPSFAALTAKHIRVAHRVFEADNCVPFASYDNFHHPAAEPSVEPFASRAYRNYLEISKHSPIILSGDGGDDVLTGQSWPYFVNLWSARKWPEIARVVGSFLWAHGTLPPLGAGVRSKLREMLSGSDPMEGYPDWLNPEFEKRNALREKWGAAKIVAEIRHPNHPQAYAALHKGYWSSVLESEDPGNTQVALATRAPLLDLRVLRFLLRVPPVPWCVDKELSRRAMMGHLPEAILKRPKTPLVQDPLEVCLESGKWSPIPLREPTPAIHGFVNWQRWIETLKYTKGYGYALNFSPLALARWLKDVENAWRIQ